GGGGAGRSFDRFTVGPIGALGAADGVSDEVSGGTSAASLRPRRPKTATRMITTASTGKNGPGAHQLNATSHSSSAAATAITHTGTRRSRSEVTHPSMA